MGYYKAISVAALGIASLALYKTGALNPAIKTAVKTGNKVSNCAEEIVKKAKSKFNSIKSEIENEKDEPITGEIVNENS